MKLPAQSPPIGRGVSSEGGRTVSHEVGVRTSQTACDGLTGLAQQMCYAVTYGV
jgi:hypothetical protein